MSAARLHERWAAAPAAQPASALSPIDGCAKQAACRGDSAQGGFPATQQQHWAWRSHMAAMHHDHAWSSALLCLWLAWGNSSPLLSML